MQRPGRPDVPPRFRYSLCQLFEVLTAFAAVLAVERFAERLNFVDGVFMLQAVFYPVKIFVGIHARHRPSLALAAYAFCIGVFSVWPLFFSCVGGPVVTPFVALVYVPIVFFGVPTITFCWDLLVQRVRSVRFLLWRSVFEIVIIYPLWIYLAVVAIVCIRGSWH